MLKIHKQTLAENDLIDIWVFSLGEWGLNQADLYIDEIESNFYLSLSLLDKDWA